MPTRLPSGPTRGRPRKDCVGGNSPGPLRWRGVGRFALETTVLPERITVPMSSPSSSRAMPCVPFNSRKARSASANVRPEAASMWRTGWSCGECRNSPTKPNSLWESSMHSCKDCSKAGCGSGPAMNRCCTATTAAMKSTEFSPAPRTNTSPSRPRRRTAMRTPNGHENSGRTKFRHYGRNRRRAQHSAADDCCTPNSGRVQHFISAGRREAASDRKTSCRLSRER